MLNRLNNLYNTEITKEDVNKYSGISSVDSFGELNEGYDSFKIRSVNLLKKLSKNNDTDNENYKKNLTLNKNLVSHNNAHASKITNNSPIHKNPPKNKHISKNKSKRNICE